MIYWLFKEFRIIYINSLDKRDLELKNSIKAYTKLLIVLKNFELNNCDNLFSESIAESSSYLPKRILNMILNNDLSNEEIRAKIIGNISSEIKALKLKQKTITTLGNSNSLFDTLEYYSNVYRLNTFIIPIVLSFISTLVCMLLFLYVISLISSDGFYNSLKLIFAGFAFPFSFLISILVIDLILNKKIKNIKRFIILYLLFIVLPLVLTYFCTEKFVIISVLLEILFIIKFPKSKNK